MKIVKNLMLIEYFVIIVCAFRVTNGQISSKPLTIWGNQNDNDDRPDQQMEPRSKRSVFECGVHGREPAIDSLSTGTTLPGEWPWVVTLVRSSNKGFMYAGGANLIDTRFAISAASSFNKPDMEPDNLAIIVGIWDVSRLTYDEGSARFLTAIYFDKEYNIKAQFSVLALLVLKEPVTYSKLVKPVCLWEGEDDQNDLEKPIQHGTVLGKIKIPYEEAPRQFKMSIMPKLRCRRVTKHSNYDDEKIFCAAEERSLCHML